MWTGIVKKCSERPRSGTIDGRELCPSGLGVHQVVVILNYTQTARGFHDFQTLSESLLQDCRDNWSTG